MAPLRRSASMAAALLLAALAPIVPSWAAADDATAATGRDLRLHLGAGRDFGTTELVTAEFADGSRKTIDANDGFSLHLGADWRRGRASVRATAGVKASVINASNARVWYVALPVELLGFWELAPLRLGGGLSLSLEPRVFGSGDASSLDARFDPSVGVVFQGEWVVPTSRGGSLAFGPRFTWQLLRLHATGDTVRANAFGIALGWTR